MNLLGYAHCFTSIRISHIKDHLISVYQDRYATSIVAKYLDTFMVKTNTKFHKKNLPSDMIFDKADASTSGEQVDKLNR